MIVSCGTCEVYIRGGQVGMPCPKCGRKCEETAAFMKAGQADGAIPNGTAIEKCDSEPGDAHPDGARGKVLSSVALPHPDTGKMLFAYWVSWDDDPETPIFSAGRIRPAKLGSMFN